MYMFWVALVLGVVEGLTEFLPVSSTGHLIIASELMDFQGQRAQVFAIFIQLGAILSVVWEFRGRLTKIVTDLPKHKESRQFAASLAIAFVPAAVLGLTFHDFITDKLFSTRSVAYALIVGAILILIVDWRPRHPTTHVAEKASWKQALAIGLAQCLALWPGFSRSAATILGGLGVGLDRRAATEFSFFLAIPVMIAATGYDLLKQHEALEGSDWGWLALCFMISFLVALVAIRWLLKFVSHNSFRPFAYYRLIVGFVILLFF